jgi:hypothetical protein
VLAMLHKNGWLEKMEKGDHRLPKKTGNNAKVGSPVVAECASSSSSDGRCQNLIVMSSGSLDSEL